MSYESLIFEKTEIVIESEVGIEHTFINSPNGRPNESKKISLCSSLTAYIKHNGNIHKESIKIN